MSCKCVDDQAWSSSYGGCRSYARGTSNHAYCVQDGAAAFCQLACDSCQCAPAPEENDGLDPITITIATIALVVFCAPVIILYFYRSAKTIRDARQRWQTWVINRWKKATSKSSQSTDEGTERNVTTFKDKIMSKVHAFRNRTKKSAVSPVTEDPRAPAFAAHGAFEDDQDRSALVSGHSRLLTAPEDDTFRGHHLSLGDDDVEQRHFSEQLAQGDQPIGGHDAFRGRRVVLDGVTAPVSDPHEMPSAAGISHHAKDTRVALDGVTAPVADPHEMPYAAGTLHHRDGGSRVALDGVTAPVGDTYEMPSAAGASAADTQSDTRAGLLSSGRFPQPDFTATSPSQERAGPRLVAPGTSGTLRTGALGSPAFPDRSAAPGFALRPVRALPPIDGSVSYAGTEQNFSS